MRTSSPAVWLLGAIVLLALPSTTRAEPRELESIEWVVADSDWALAGKVVQVQEVRGPGKKKYEVATVAVARTFRGKHAPRATFILDNYDDPVARRWLAEGAPMLFCLVEARRVANDIAPAAKFAWALRNDGWDHSAVVLAQSARGMPVLTREFAVLTRPVAILKRVEQAALAVRKGPRPRPRVVLVPTDTELYEQFGEENEVSLTVPGGP
jgi:hypothetical protein